MQRHPDPPRPPAEAADHPGQARELTVDRGDDQLAVALHLIDNPDAPLFVFFPAMGVPARYYSDFAGALNDAGFAVAVADLRGTGASRPRPSRRSDYGLRDLADDVEAVLAALAGLRAGRRTILAGHSLGGQACLLHLARTGDPDVDALVLAAVGLPYWRCYPGPRGLGVLAFAQTISLVSRLVGYWPGWGFGGRQSRGVIRDWAHTNRTGAFPPAWGLEQRLPRVPHRVLAISVEHDPYTPAPTVDHLAGKLAAAPVKRAHLTSAEVGAALDHFRWAKVAAGTVAATITTWLDPVNATD